MMDSNSYLSLLRKKLGLTIEAFATALDCHTGQLAMAETGKRSLPSKSSLLVSYWELSLMEAEKDESDDGGNSETLQKTLSSRIKFAKAKRNKLEFLLETCSNKANTLHTLLKTIAVFRTKELPAISEIAHLQIEILERKALSKLKLMRLQIATYQIDMAALSAEITEAEKLLS
jgi:transcriptional regulator with XRE-family HTH domain